MADNGERNFKNDSKKVTSDRMGNLSLRRRVRLPPKRSNYAIGISPRRNNNWRSSIRSQELDQRLRPNVDPRTRHRGTVFKNDLELNKTPMPRKNPKYFIVNMHKVQKSFSSQIEPTLGNLATTQNKKIISRNIKKYAPTKIQ